MVFCAAPTGPRGGPERAEIAQLVEHATENRGVASSNLALGTIIQPASSGSGSVGRASPCQGEGRGFESRLPLHSPSPYRDRLPAPLPLRLVVGQRTLDPLAEVRILDGQPTQTPIPGGLAGHRRRAEVAQRGGLQNPYSSVRIRSSPPQLCARDGPARVRFRYPAGGPER